MMLDITPGELYAFVDGDKKGIYQFDRKCLDGSLEFVNQATNRAEMLPQDEFENMRRDGKAIRMDCVIVDSISHLAGQIDPGGFLEMLRAVGKGTQGAPLVGPQSQIALGGTSARVAMQATRGPNE